MIWYQVQYCSDYKLPYRNWHAFKEASDTEAGARKKWARFISDYGDYEEIIAIRLVSVKNLLIREVLDFKEFKR